MKTNNDLMKLHIYVNGIQKTDFIVDLTKSERNYVEKVFYKCVTTDIKGIKLGMKFTLLRKESYSEVRPGRIKVDWDERVLFDTVQDVLDMLNSCFEYTLISEEYIDIKNCMRSIGVSCFWGYNNPELENRFFIQATTLAEAKERASQLKAIVPWLEEDKIHIANNSVWIDKESLLRTKKTTILIDILDNAKLKEFVKEERDKANATLQALSKL